MRLPIRWAAPGVHNQCVAGYASTMTSVSSSAFPKELCPVEDFETTLQATELHALPRGASEALLSVEPSLDLPWFDVHPSTPESQLFEDIAHAEQGGKPSFDDQTAAALGGLAAGGAMAEYRTDEAISPGCAYQENWHCSDSTSGGASSSWHPLASSPLRLEVLVRSSGKGKFAPLDDPAKHFQEAMHNQVLRFCVHVPAGVSGILEVTSRVNRPTGVDEAVPLSHIILSTQANFRLQEHRFGTLRVPTCELVDRCLVFHARPVYVPFKHRHTRPEVSVHVSLLHENGTTLFHHALVGWVRSRKPKP